MLCRPFYHKPQDARRKMASKLGKRINSYQGPLPPVAHMEVRGRMIAVAHSNHVAEKTTDFRQSAIPHLVAASVITKWTSALG